jgi:hypothetical protein
MGRKVLVALSAIVLLAASGCSPVEMARFNCNEGSQAACIDYQEYTRRGAPGTVSAKGEDAAVPEAASSAQSTPTGHVP